MFGKLTTVTALVAMLIVPSASSALTSTDAFKADLGHSKIRAYGKHRLPQEVIEKKSFKLHLNDGEMSTRRIGTIWADGKKHPHLGKLKGINPQIKVTLKTPFEGESGVSGWKSVFSDNPLTISDAQLGKFMIDLFGYRVIKFGLCHHGCRGIELFAKVINKGPPAPVPLPASFLLFLSAIGGVGWAGWRVRGGSRLRALPFAA